MQQQRVMAPQQRQGLCRVAQGADAAATVALLSPGAGSDTRALAELNAHQATEPFKHVKLAAAAKAPARQLPLSQPPSAGWPTQAEVRGAPPVLHHALRHTASQDPSHQPHITRGQSPDRQRSSTQTHHQPCQTPGQHSSLAAPNQQFGHRTYQGAGELSDPARTGPGRAVSPAAWRAPSPLSAPPIRAAAVQRHSNPAGQIANLGFSIGHHSHQQHHQQAAVRWQDKYTALAAQHHGINTPSEQPIVQGEPQLLGFDAVSRRDREAAERVAPSLPHGPDPPARGRDAAREGPKGGGAPAAGNENGSAARSRRLIPSDAEIAAARDSHQSSSTYVHTLQATGMTQSGDISELQVAPLPAKSNRSRRLL
ncbi:hypothetical protein V8C86DRAFT_1491562 [Haematococcus lacustris]